jgi:hypothetical protein
LAAPATFALGDGFAANLAGPTSAAPAATAAAALESAVAGQSPPAAQASAALVTLTRHDGTQTLQLRLHPEELGGLTIRVARPADGPPSVSLTADRADTLALLVRDQAQLHRSLDQAGIPAEGRTLSFHLASRDGSTPIGPDANGSGALAGGTLGGSMQGGGTAARDMPSFAGGQPHGRASPTDDTRAAAARQPDEPLPASVPGPGTGIDITA